MGLKACAAAAVSPVFTATREREGGCALLCCAVTLLPEPAPSRTLPSAPRWELYRGETNFFSSPEDVTGQPPGRFLTEMPLVRTAVGDGGRMFFLGSWDRDCSLPRL